MMKVCVIGLGYIGLPTAAVMAQNGVSVIGVDVMDHVIEAVNQGKTHIVEPGLEASVGDAVARGALVAQKEMPEADAYLIAVPTPVNKDRSADISYVEGAIRSLAPALQKGAVVVLESTSPVGTTEKMRDLLGTLRPDLKMPTDDQAGDVAIAYCPERVLPGNALEELVKNDRSVGGISQDCSKKARAVYETFVKGELLVTNARTAEMSKLTENAYRDVCIAFANELSLVCDASSIDVWELIKLANHHPRVNILQPGPGVGGHCIAVDPWFIIDAHKDITPLMYAARTINDNKPDYVIARVREAVEGLGLDRKPVIGCLGLAFKPDIDDLRTSPALEIVKKLQADGRASILAVEPHVNEAPKGLDGVELVDLDECLKRADIVVALVAHSSFKSEKSRINQIKLLDFVNL